MSDLLRIKEAVYEMSLFFNQQPNDERITAYAKALQNYTPKQIIFAFKQVIGSGSAFFPSLAEILAHLKPVTIASRESADIVANEVIQKVIDLGVYRLGQAYDELSPLAKKAIENNQYILTEIANSDRDSLTSIRAQLRDMIKAIGESAKAQVKNEKLVQVGIRPVELRTADYSGYLPEVKNEK